MNRCETHRGSTERCSATGFLWHTVIGIALVFTVGAAAGNLYAQSPSADTLRKDVAKVRVEREGLTAETAAALPVGWSDSRLYLVTVYHAVGPVLSGGIEHKVTAIRIEWPNSPELQPAQMFDRYDPVLDLAVLSVDLPPTFTRQAVLSDVSVQAGQSVTLIGHPASGDWSVWSGQVQNENSGSDVTRFAYSGANAPGDGFSGGPVFGQNNTLLGIHSATPTTSYGIGIKTGDIVRLLSVWRIPGNRFLKSATNPDPVRDLTNWIAEYQIEVVFTEDLSPIESAAYVYINVSRSNPCRVSLTELAQVKLKVGMVGPEFPPENFDIDLSKSALLVETNDEAFDRNEGPPPPLKLLRVFPANVGFYIRVRDEDAIRQIWLAAFRTCRQ
jgi:hypothetical protein